MFIAKLDPQESQNLYLVYIFEGLYQSTLEEGRIFNLLLSNFSNLILIHWFGNVLFHSLNSTSDQMGFMGYCILMSLLIPVWAL